MKSDYKTVLSLFLILIQCLPIACISFSIMFINLSSWGINAMGNKINMMEKIMTFMMIVFKKINNVNEAKYYKHQGKRKVGGKWTG